MQMETDGQMDRDNIYMPFPPFFEWQEHKKKKINKEFWKKKYNVK